MGIHTDECCCEPCLEKHLKNNKRDFELKKTKVEKQLSRANEKISELEFKVGTLFNIIAANCSHKAPNVVMPMDGPPTRVCTHESHYCKKCGVDWCPMGKGL